MPTALQLRRGTTSQNDSFTGAVGELSIDTTLDSIRVHDGSTAGGFSSVGVATTQTLTNKTLTSPVLNTGVSGTAVLDEDGMGSNSATQLATQQSIKAYVDAQLTGSDLDFQGDSGGALSIDLDSETLDIAGGTGIDTSGSSNTLTVAIDSTVTTLTGSQTLTNKTLTAPVLNTSTVGTSITPATDDGATLGSANLNWSDIFIADGGIIKLGDDQDVTITHVADSGIAIKSAATADDKPVTITLQTGEVDIEASDVIGSIEWQAPNEGTGTDAITVCGAIKVVSEGDFSATNNATKMAFHLGLSEAATEKAQLSSAGAFQCDSTLTCTPTAILLIKDSGGSTLKTVNGVAAN